MCVCSTGGGVGLRKKKREAMSSADPSSLPFSQTFGKEEKEKFLQMSLGKAPAAERAM